MRAITGLIPNNPAWSEAPEGSEYLSESFASLGDARCPRRGNRRRRARGADGTNDDDAGGSGGGGGASAGSGGARRGRSERRLGHGVPRADRLAAPFAVAGSPRTSSRGAPGGPRSGSPAPKPARLSGTNDRDAKTLWIGRAAELAPLFENGDVLESLAAIEPPTTKPGVFSCPGPPAWRGTRFGTSACSRRWATW